MIYHTKGLFSTQSDFSLLVQDFDVPLLGDRGSNGPFRLNVPDGYGILDIGYEILNENIILDFKRTVGSDFSSFFIHSSYQKKFSFYREGLLVSFCY